MPLLQSIQLGGNALQGDNSDKRKMITKEPYNYANTMTSVRGGQCNFKNIGTIILDSNGFV